MKRVLIIEAQMKQYRAPFYARLYERLHSDGIRLKVAYSDPARKELAKNDNCDLPREYGMKVPGQWLFNERFLFQPLLREISASDLVISDQANKLVLTHCLLLLARLGKKSVAFWGHGENRKETRLEFSERYRKWTLNWPTWWFAYTAGTAEYLERQGVSRSKITVVQNSVDTTEIRNVARSLNREARASLRAELGISPYAPVGIFIGALHESKAVFFLLEAARRICKHHPDFHLILAGGGTQEEAVKESASQDSRLHVVGPKFGGAKARLLAIADVFLLPGAVGLAILDGFAAGLPLVTTKLWGHGPEIEYLEIGRNGLMTAYRIGDYARAVDRLLCDPERLRVMREAALASVEKYSIETMVENFRDGIQQCLALKQPIADSIWSPSDRAIPKKSNGLEMDAGSIHLNCLMTTSWDDGHPLDLRVAEMLEKYGLTGTFYVPRCAPQVVMHAAQIRELSDLFEIGGHTLDHVLLDRTPVNEVKSQLSGSRHWIEDITGKSCSAFCFPAGKFRPRQLQLVREAGFRAARTVELLSIQYPDFKSGLFLIPTTVQAYPHTPANYAGNVLKRPVGYLRLRAGALLHSRYWVVLARYLLQLAIERHGVFHLWGHSWEIEKEGQWGQLAELLAIIAGLRKELTCVTNGELCGAPAHALEAVPAESELGRASGAG